MGFEKRQSDVIQKAENVRVFFTKELTLIFDSCRHRSRKSVCQKNVFFVVVGLSQTD
jgi:hypothetical protein